MSGEAGLHRAALKEHERIRSTVHLGKQGRSSGERTMNSSGRVSNLVHNREHQRTTPQGRAHGGNNMAHIGDDKDNDRFKERNQLSLRTLPWIKWCLLIIQPARRSAP